MWSGKTDPKYRSAEHRARRKEGERLLARGFTLWCMQDVCVLGDRTIRPGMRWCVGHDADGARYLGPVHEACNQQDAARRGHAAQSVPRRWVL